MLELAISGLIAGLTYALAGAAVVVAFRASRVLNFALGGIGGLGAYVAFSAISGKLPWGVGFVLALLAGAVVAVACEIGVSRPLSRSSTFTATIGTLGALLVVQGAVEWIWSSETKVLPTPLRSMHLRVGTVALSASDLITVVVGVVALAALLFVVNRTALGLRMRAVSAGPLTSATLGINVPRTTSAAWALSGAAGAAAAILVTLGTNQMVPTSFSGFLFLALVAVVVGGMTSLNGVVLGGLIFGVALNYLESYLSTQLTYTFTFVLITGFLLLRPHGLIGGRERHVSEPDLPAPPRWRSRWSIWASPRPERMAEAGIRSTALAGLAVLAVMVLLWWVAPRLVQLALPNVVATYLAILGLDVLLGYCGQFSLAQGSFMAVGAYAGSLAIIHLGAPAWAALPLGALAGAVVGVVVGLPAIRLSGIYLGQVTLIFAFVVPELIYRFKGTTGGGTGLPLPPVGNLSGLRQYGLYLSIAAVVTAAVQILVRGRMGRRWRTVRDDQLAASGLGQRVTVTKLVAFAVGCGLAGLAGVMQGMTTAFISPDSFSVWTSVYLQAALVIGGLASITGNMLGALFAVVAPLYLQSAHIPPDFIFGSVFVVILLLVPGGLATVGPTVAGMVMALRRSSEQRADSASNRVVDVERRAPGSVAEPAALLQLRGVSAGYRGGRALHEVDVDVMTGEIVGLVGPNGAGKSTLLRAVGGLIACQAGTITIDGTPLGRSRNFDAASRGVAHVVEGRGVFPNLTVEENLRLGVMAARDADPATSQWVLDLFPRLAERRRQVAGTLSGGEQQMLAVARSLLSEPKLLMLDEPSLGLAPTITHHLFASLAQVRKAGVAMLIVEQNLEEVFALADRCYLVAAGTIVASGTPAELRRREDLISTYFGLNAQSLRAGSPELSAEGSVAPGGGGRV